MNKTMSSYNWMVSMTMGRLYSTGRIQVLLQEVLPRDEAVGSINFCGIKGHSGFWFLVEIRYRCNETHSSFKNVDSMTCLNRTSFTSIMANDFSVFKDNIMVPKLFVSKISENTWFSAH